MATFRTFEIHTDESIVDLSEAFQDSRLVEDQRPYEREVNRPEIHT